MDHKDSLLLEALTIRKHKRPCSKKGHMRPWILALENQVLRTRGFFNVLSFISVGKTEGLPKGPLICKI